MGGLGGTNFLIINFYKFFNHQILQIFLIIRKEIHMKKKELNKENKLENVSEIKEAGVEKSRVDGVKERVERGEARVEGGKTCVEEGKERVEGVKDGVERNKDRVESGEGSVEDVKGGEEEVKAGEEKETAVFYTGVDGVSLDIFSMMNDPKRRILRGKGIYNDVRKGFTFTENPKRVNRNRKCGEVTHGIIMTRPNGNFVITLRFSPKEKYLEAVLCSEVKNLLKIVKI